MIGITTIPPTTTPNIDTNPTTPIVFTTTATPIAMSSIVSPSNVGNPGDFLNSIQYYLVNSPLLNTANGDNDDVAMQIDNINANLNNIANSLTTNNSADVLSQQSEIQVIVNKEMDRLQQKKQSIENATTTQQRMMILNDSFLKRQRMYSQIAIAIMIGVSVILIIRYFSIQYPELENLANVLSIFIIVCVFIYCMWLMIAIMRRDPIYFDQLAYIPDKLTPAPQSNYAYAPPGVQAELLSRTTNFTSSCTGPDCCSFANGTVWDSSNNICVPNIPPIVYQSSQKSSNLNTTTRPSVKKEPFQPSSANEYSNYGKY